METIKVINEYGYPFENGDALAIRFNNTVSATFHVYARYYLDNGREVLMDKFYTPTTDGVLNESIEPMTRCRLVSIQVAVTSGTVNRGATWVEVRHMRGITSNGFPVAVILNGYPSNAASLSYPQNVLVEPGSGSGMFIRETYDRTSYAIGNNIAFAFPSKNRMGRILGVTVTTQNANLDVGMRQIDVALLPTGGNPIIFPPTTPYPLQAVGNYYAIWGDYKSREIVTWGAQGRELIPLPLGSLDFKAGDLNIFDVRITPAMANEVVYSVQMDYLSWVAP